MRMCFSPAMQAAAKSARSQLLVRGENLAAMLTDKDQAMATITKLAEDYEKKARERKQLAATYTARAAHAYWRGGKAGVASPATAHSPVRCMASRDTLAQTNAVSASSNAFVCMLDDLQITWTAAWPCCASTVSPTMCARSGQTCRRTSSRWHKCYR